MKSQAARIWVRRADRRPRTLGAGTAVRTRPRDDLEALTETPRVFRWVGPLGVPHPPGSASLALVEHLLDVLRRLAEEVGRAALAVEDLLQRWLEDRVVHLAEVLDVLEVELRGVRVL